MNDADAADILREEVDELHERFAALTERVASLELDRDTLLASVEAQSEANEQAAADHDRLVRAMEEMRAKLESLEALERGPA